MKILALISILMLGFSMTCSAEIKEVSVKFINCSTNSYYVCAKVYGEKAVKDGQQLKVYFLKDLSGVNSHLRMDLQNSLGELRQNHQKPEIDMVVNGEVVMDTQVDRETGGITSRYILNVAE